VAGKTDELGRTGNPQKILSTNMKIMVQIWSNFLFANVTPNIHVSNMTMDKTKFIFCITKEVVIDVADLKRFIDFSCLSLHRRGTTRPLGLPSLINGLCKPRGVEIPSHPMKKLRPTLNKSYIEAHYPLDDVPRPAPHQAEPSTSSHQPEQTKTAQNRSKLAPTFTCISLIFSSSWLQATKYSTIMKHFLCTPYTNITLLMAHFFACPLSSTKPM